MHSKKVLKIIAIILFITIVLLAVVLIKNINKDVEEYKEIADTQTKVIDAVVEEKDNTFSIDWDELLAINKDIVAWIRIPDTNINYPVIQGKSNSQYIRKNIYGNYSRGGTLFVDANIEAPFECVNTIVYGHNLLNGSMFSEIKKYSQNEYYQSHKIIYIYLPNNEVREYRVVSFHTINAHNKDIYNPYVTDINEFAVPMFKDNKITANNEIYSNDKVITLSTCTNGDTDGRYVLHAVWHRTV